MKTEQNGRFPHLLTWKTPKTPFFYLKVLNKIYFQDFFEEYINFKFFYGVMESSLFNVLDVI